RCLSRFWCADSEDSRLIAVFIFFFQAEDGIRDFHVTGVQTCALPICLDRRADLRGLAAAGRRVAGLRGGAQPRLTTALSGGSTRSEERRVGKECRSRRAADHGKTNGGQGTAARGSAAGVGARADACRV